MSLSDGLYRLGQDLLRDKNLMSEYKKRFGNLNDKQKEAVEYIYGSLLVVAGPGSGKTELLSLRVANILQQTDIPASGILCLTFTDSAAINMRQRLIELIGREAYRVAIHTFHNFGVEIINHHPEFFYNAATFMPADELMQVEILRGIFNDLVYKDPLKKEHPERGYSYMSHVQRAIGDLKKAGITPDEFLKIIEHNEKELKKLNGRANQIFGERVSKKVFGEIRAFIKELAIYKSSDKKAGKFPVDHFGPIHETLKRSLEDVLIEAEHDDLYTSIGAGWSTKPVSEWKRDWIQKFEDGSYVIRDFSYIDKMYSLARIYKEYTERLHKLGYYDFDDMLLDTIGEVRRNQILRYELQEQYQFVLVDEFQDSNDAQMRLLELLFDFADEQPNVMAVGDDDQAIYKFQGAELSNILRFKQQYKAKIINLVQNYRSTQKILDFSKSVIRKGKERLENRFKEISKDLVAAGQKLKLKSDIYFKSFDTNIHEYYWIAREIKKLIDAGAAPESIAVISRQHKMLQEIAPFFHRISVPVAYERQRNVLEEPHIVQIVQIARYIDSLMDKSAPDDDLLPEILSYPFWGLNRIDIWKLSLTAGREYKPWLEVMLESGNQKLKTIANFFLDLAARAKHEPLEHMLDKIIAGPITDKTCLTGLVCNFKEYYFSKEKLKSNLAEYLSFLSGLKIFYQALREYKHGQLVKVADLIEFVKSYHDNKMSLTDNSPFVNARNAINLLTAHKSKGMEFETVFIISCQDRIWAKSFNNSYLPFPHNLPISPAGDNIDDQLRLFYVALTRCKANLYLTSYDLDDEGYDSSKLSFVVDHLNKDKEKFDMARAGEMLDVLIVSNNRPPFYDSEKVLLEQYLKDYKMSITHLNNFLNVADGGPQQFLEHNLLRFPQVKTSAGCFGSAIHGAIERLYLYLKKEGKLPGMEQVQKRFEILLKAERLSEIEFSKLVDRGKDALATYYKNNKDNFSAEHLIETKFKNENVIIGQAALTGEIDKMVKEQIPYKIGSCLRVHDLKTGRVPADFNGKDDYEKIKLYQYKRQLVFYKLLVENSRSFSKYKVNKGVLEFVEAEDDDPREFTLEITAEMARRLEDLIQAVFAKIITLDFPDISKYPPTLDGIFAFENDLLK